MHRGSALESVRFQRSRSGRDGRKEEAAEAEAAAGSGGEEGESCRRRPALSRNVHSNFPGRASHVNEPGSLFLHFFPSPSFLRLRASSSLPLFLYFPPRPNTRHKSVSSGFPSFPHGLSPRLLFSPSARFSFPRSSRALSGKHLRTWPACRTTRKRRTRVTLDAAPATSAITKIDSLVCVEERRRARRVRMIFRIRMGDSFLVPRGTRWWLLFSGIIRGSV